ncbi:hypothetical protein BV25DRAFT_1917901 [Artomyces pyxidatus]|uniref:Uncharacterized protein n=1 Tax=Artomyces pyxidatus TaxID=48021 RepID=A0ACB8SVS2_9AGAM|nr:hypothetical protein BV25DRAFT_1917901 [Artomyces pyxidatus]
MSLDNATYNAIVDIFGGEHRLQAVDEWSMFTFEWLKDSFPPTHHLESPGQWVTVHLAPTMAGEDILFSDANAQVICASHEEHGDLDGMPELEEVDDCCGADHSYDLEREMWPEDGLYETQSFPATPSDGGLKV